MQYPAVVIANEIIKLANAEKKPITPMKLQKILFLANGINVKRLKEKLIQEPFEAWEYGPVVSSVYNTYRDYKGGIIEEPKDELVSTGTYSIQMSSAIPIDEVHRGIIKEAWDNAKNLSALTLSAWSHNKNSPWDKARNKVPRSQYIAEEDIQSYFENFIQ